MMRSTQQIPATYISTRQEADGGGCVCGIISQRAANQRASQALRDDDDAAAAAAAAAGGRRRNCEPESGWAAASHWSAVNWQRRCALAGPDRHLLRR